MKTNSWVLKSTTAQGFMGVGSNPLTLILDRPVVLLMGPNGSGKSTMVSSIEWALFGSIELGGSYNIPELGGNRAERYSLSIHRDSNVAQVDLRFERSASVLHWKRTRSRANPNIDNDIVECDIDGEQIEPNALGLLGITQDVYRRVVAPRQTTLRALLTSETSERNKALDELFGIEKMNDLTVGLSRAKAQLHKRIEDLADRFNHSTESLERELERRFDERTKLWTAAIDDHIESINMSLEGAKKDCRRMSVVDSEKCG